MNFRKIHNSVNGKKHARDKYSRQERDRNILDEYQEVTTVAIDKVTNGIGLSIIEAKVFDYLIACITFLQLIQYYIITITD